MDFPIGFHCSDSVPSWWRTVPNTLNSCGSLMVVSIRILICTLPLPLNCCLLSSLYQVGNNPDCFGHGNIIPDKVIIGICFQCLVSRVKRSIGQSGDHMAVDRPHRTENVHG